MSDDVLHCEKCGATEPPWLVVLAGGRDRWFEHIAQPPNAGLDAMLTVFCETCAPERRSEIARLSGEMNTGSAFQPVALMNQQYADWLEEKRSRSRL